MIQVACCLVRNERSQVLLAQKPSGCWEFPGGKQEPSESLLECAEREILEELGIVVSAHNAFDKTVIVGDPNKQYELILVECKFMAGELALTEHLEICWVPLSEIGGMNLCPGDRKLFELNFKSQI